MAAKKSVKKAKSSARTAKPARAKSARSQGLALSSVSPSMTVADLGRSLAWYRDVLGFSVAERWERDGKLMGVGMSAGKAFFMLGQDDWKKGRDRVKGEGVRLWCETGHPDIAEAKAFAEAIHKQFPGKRLAYNCSPSFNWKKKLDDATIAKFQRELGAMGYKFQFITLAGFHALNFAMFELAKGYKATQMTAYVALQQAEFAAEKDGYTATKHQREVGAGYFDRIATTVDPKSSTTALTGSTEEGQFH